MAAAAEFLEEAASKVRSRLDEVSTTIAEIEARVSEEVEPLRRERSELEEALDRITGRGSRAPRRRAPTRTQRGKNQEAILTTLGTEQMSPGDVAEKTGIAQNVVYNTLARLAEQGAVTKVPIGGGRVAYKRA